MRKIKQILGAVVITFLLSGCAHFVINEKELIIIGITQGEDEYKYKYSFWHRGVGVGNFYIQSNEFFQLGDTVRIRSCLP